MLRSWSHWKLSSLNASYRFVKWKIFPDRENWKKYRPTTYAPCESLTFFFADMTRIFTCQLHICIWIFHNSLPVHIISVGFGVSFSSFGSDGNSSVTLLLAIQILSIYQHTQTGTWQHPESVRWLFLFGTTTTTALVPAVRLPKQLCDRIQQDMIGISNDGGSGILGILQSFIPISFHTVVYDSE